MPFRYLIFFLSLLLSGNVTAQDWRYARWQTTDGTLDSARVKLPPRPLTGNTNLPTDRPVGPQALNTQSLEWLVTATDTIFVRRYYRVGTSSLYQLVVAGTYDLYRSVGRKGRSAWQLRTPEGLMKIDPEDYENQMLSLIETDCPGLKSGKNSVKTSYKVLLAAEQLNACIGDGTLDHSTLAESFAWRLNFTLNTPLNLINRNVSLGNYWSLRVGAELPVRRFYHGFFVTGGVQPYYYRHNSALRLGPLQGEYDQDWEMAAVQFNLGGKLEIWPIRKFTPYGEFGLGMVTPIFHRRSASLNDGEPQSPGYPIEAGLRGGMSTSFGVYWSYGLRMRAKQNWLFALQITRDGMFVNFDYGTLSSGSRSLLFGQENSLLIGEWRRWELLIQKQF